MPQRNSSGRGGTATATKSRPMGRASGTSQISETDIARMRVDEIRIQLRKRGITGTSALRKPDLVTTLARALRTERRQGGAAKRAAGPAKRAPDKRAAGPAKRSVASAKRAAAPTKPGPRTAASARASAGAAKPSTGRATGPTGRGGGAARAGATSKIRQGRSSSRSLQYAQPISSLDDQPERPGRSLVTTNHEVIRRWARARQAKPATISGTEREGRPGVLTFNLPGYRESSRIRQITWDEWFQTFDARRLNLIYQEQLRDGRPSNFFRTESPDREGG